MIKNVLFSFALGGISLISLVANAASSSSYVCIVQGGKASGTVIEFSQNSPRSAYLWNFSEQRDFDGVDLNNDSGSKTFSFDRDGDELKVNAWAESSSQELILTVTVDQSKKYTDSNPNGLADRGDGKQLKHYHEAVTEIFVGIADSVNSKKDRTILETKSKTKCYF